MTTTTRPTLYTIGHGRRDLEGVLTQLRDAGVTTLVDVRTFPVSRFAPHWNKKNLSRPGALGTIGYKHMPELGGYNADKTHPRTKDDAWVAGIAWLAWVLRDCPDAVPAIMCAELDHTDCHRHGTVEPDLKLLIPDLQVVHLAAPPKKAATPKVPRQSGFGF